MKLNKIPLIFRSNFPFLVGISIIFVTLGFIRLSLYQSTLRFSEEFERQNFVDLSNSDIFSLSTKLNSLSTSIPWVCIKASNNGILFFEKSRGSCKKGLMQDLALIKSVPDGNTVIEVVLGLDNEIRNAALLFLLMQSMMLVLLWYTTYKKQKIEMQNKLLLVNLANQVSHDIRSPLAALEMISTTLEGVSEDKRIVIRNSVNRIKDIANDLLQKNRESNLSYLQNDLNKEGFLSSQQLETVLLSPLIESIVTEKRLQYALFADIEIDYQPSSGVYGLFVSVQSIEFKRAISNFINNSIEAMSGLTGKVELKLSSDDFGNVVLDVFDQGIGMPPHVISKLGEHGYTFGKENGNGLGLFHAFNLINSSHGKIEIKSKHLEGTHIRISLPPSESPVWFASEIVLNKFQKVIICDDDESIHDIWKNKFKTIVAAGNIELIHFKSIGELQKFYSRFFSELDDAKFLIDYEIRNSDETGLDLIEKLGIQSQSILVTSRYEEKSIKVRCESMNVKIIPKPMAGFVPIAFS